MPTYSFQRWFQPMLPLYVMPLIFVFPLLLLPISFSIFPLSFVFLLFTLTFSPISFFPFYKPCVRISFGWLGHGPPMVYPAIDTLFPSKSFISQMVWIQMWSTGTFTVYRSSTSLGQLEHFCSVVYPAVRSWHFSSFTVSQFTTSSSTYKLCSNG